MTDAPGLNLHDWAAEAEGVADPAAWEYLTRGSGANVTATEDIQVPSSEVTVSRHSKRLAPGHRQDGSITLRSNRTA